MERRNIGWLAAGILIGNVMSPITYFVGKHIYYHWKDAAEGHIPRKKALGMEFEYKINPKGDIESYITIDGKKMAVCWKNEEFYFADNCSPKRERDQRPALPNTQTLENRLENHPLSAYIPPPKGNEQYQK